MSDADVGSASLTGDKTGEVIDTKYKLISLLGEGGMGAVYEASHAQTGRRVAVKVIRSQGTTIDAERVRRFQREAKAAGAVDTQHIAQVLDAGTDPKTGSPYLVLEYLHGEDLQALLDREGALRPSVALRIAAQACLALAAAHGAGVLHRDIKPANLFLSRGEEGTVVVKVLDFGLAKIKREDQAAPESWALTKADSLLGSPRYMSPEQARTQKDIDYRTDIWSLGLVLYRALSGRLPHDHAGGFGDLIVAICSEPARPLLEIAPWVPAKAAELVDRALKIDRAARIGSAAEMLAELKALLPEGLTIRADELVSLDAETRARLTTEAEALQAAGLASTMIAEAPALPEALVAATGAALSSARPRRGVWRLGAVVALGLIGLGIYKGLSRGASGPSPATSSAVASTPISAPSPGTTGGGDLRRSVSLIVLPEGVSVDIEGTNVPVEAGQITITGSLGSRHRVRLSQGGREKVETVVITDSGALPAWVELAPEAPVSSGSASAPVPVRVQKPRKPKENPLTPSTFQ